MSRFPTGHVGLNVCDLDRSRDAYVGVFGFDVVQRSDEPGRRFAFLADEGVSSGDLFFEDPDGTRLEIYAPRGADAEGRAPDADVPTCGVF